MENKSGGIGFFGLLALILVTLKLAGIGMVATWSWFAILSPIWVPIAIVIVILLATIILSAL